MIKSLEDFKRERLEEFDKQFNCGLGLMMDEPNYKGHFGNMTDQVRRHLSETIDLLNKRTEQVVKEVIGRSERTNDKTMSREQMSHRNKRNELRREQRQRAKILLGGKDVNNK